MRHIKVTVLNWDTAANPCLGCDNKKDDNLIIISMDLANKAWDWDYTM